MKINTIILLTISCILLNEIKCEVNYQAEVDKYCKNIDLKASETDGEERQKQRDAHPNEFSLSYSEVAKIVSGDYGKIAKPRIVVALVFSAATILFALTMVFIVIFNFCCCRKMGKNSSEKCYFYTTIIMIILFIVFLILMLVYAGKTNQQLTKIQCVTSRLVNDIINGKNSGEIQFIGFTGLINMLTTFRTDLDSLKDLEGEFNKVTALNIPSVTQAALDSIPPYKTEFETKVSADGNGATAISITVKALPETIKVIETEFGIYNEIGNKFNQASEVSKKFKDNTELDNAKAKLDEAVLQITSIKTSVTDVTDKFYEYNGYFSQATEKVYISNLIITLVLLAIFLWIISTLACMAFKKKCMGCSWIIKIVLVIVSILALALAIMAIVLCVMSFAFGSTCNLFKEILTTTDLNTILNDLKVGNIGENGKLLNGCVAVGGSGSLDDLVGEKINLGDIETILDGFSMMDQLKKNVTDAPENSITIQEITNEYTKFENGIYINQEKAIENLALVNNQIDCDNQFMTFNSANCTASSSCQVVRNLASYSAPACANAVVNTQFTNLKTYDTENSVLMTDMINKLFGTDPNTPNSKYKKNIEVFKQAFNSYDVIKTKLDKTLNLVMDFSNKFDQIANCRIMRLEFLYFEDAICFGFNYHLYLFFIFTLCFTIFLTIMIMSICCTMRHSDNKKNESANGNIGNSEKAPQFYN
jgi:hypothetical protein